MLDTDGNSITLNANCNTFEVTDTRENHELKGTKWQLVKVKDVAQIDAEELLCIDYSQHNIVYEFKTNNILTVSGVGVIDKIKDYRGHEIGNHSYYISVGATCPLCLPSPPRLVIDDVGYTHHIFFEKELSIELSHYRITERDFIFTVYYFEKK